MLHGTWGRGAMTRQARRAPLPTGRWQRRDTVARQRPAGPGLRDDGRPGRHRRPAATGRNVPLLQGLVDCLGAEGSALDDAFWSAYVEVD